MFLKKTVSVFATQLALFAVAFLTSIIIARTLGPEGKGQLALLYTFLGVLGLLTNLGLTSATTYYVSRNRDAYGRVAGTSLMLQFLLAIGAIVVVALALPLIEGLILKGGVPPLLVLLSLFFSLFAVVIGTASAIFLGLYRVDKFNYLRMVPGVAHLIFLSILLGLGRLNVTTAVISSGVAAICTAVMAVSWLRQIGTLPRPGLAQPWPRRLLSYGLRGWIGSVSQQFNYRLDVFFVNYFVGVAGLGQYSLAVTLAESLWYIPDSVATVLFPRTAADQQAAFSFTPMVSRNTAFITTMAALVMAVIIYPFLILIYGVRFGPSVAPFLVLLPGVICLSVGKVLSNDMAGHGKPQYGAWSATIALIVTVLFDILLIPRMGITGAALASTLSYSMGTAVLVYTYVRLSGNSVASILFLRQSDLALYIALFRRLLARAHRYGESRG
jgi:O-antigen/teichoic acid export membrane protein